MAYVCIILATWPVLLAEEDAGDWPWWLTVAVPVVVAFLFLLRRLLRRLLWLGAAAGAAVAWWLIKERG